MKRTLILFGFLCIFLYLGMASAEDIHLKFNNNLENAGTVNTNISVNGQNLLYGPGKISQSPRFWTNGGSVNISNNISFSFGGPFSIAFWINSTAGGANIVFIEKGLANATQNAPLWSIGSDFAGTQYRFWNTGTSFNTIISANSPTGNVHDSRWHHIVLIRNESMGLTMCIDAVCNVTNVVDNTNYTNTLPISLAYRPGSSVIVNGSMDDLRIWNNFVLSQSNINFIYNGGVGTEDSIGSGSISISLNSPDDATTASVNSLLFNASASVIGGFNFTNATLFVWKSDGSIFNKTTNIVKGTQNTTTWNITGLSLGNYEWNTLWCAQGLNCSFYLSNNTFTIGTTVISENYSTSAYETSWQDFAITVELFPGSEISLAQLVYDGRNYTVSSISSNGNYRTLSKSIDLPVNDNPFANQTNNFFWRFVFTDESSTTQETPTSTQSVGFINYQICNSTYSTKSLNLTLYDEYNQTVATVGSSAPSTFLSSWQYWAGRGEVYKNYSYQVLNNQSAKSYEFCIYPSSFGSFDFKIDGDLNYRVTGYRENQYHFRNATLSSTRSDLYLYLLNEDVATKFFLTFRQGASVISDATVTVQKFFTGLGQYITTSVLLTDNSGESTMWQEIDQKYRYYIVQNGNLLGVIEKTSLCSGAPCESSISIDTSSANQFEPYYDVYAQNILSSLTYNKTSKIVTYEFIDTTGLANYFRLEVKKVQYNQTGAIICNSQLFSPSGTLTCNMTAYSGEFVATGYISRSPERTDQILNFLTDDSVISDLGLTGIFLVMAFIIVIVFGAAVVTSGSPSGILFGLGVGMLLLKLSTLFPFTWTVVISIEVLIALIIWKVKS